MILGVDTSHFDKPIDWAEMKAAGVVWMYSKASQGSEFVDWTLAGHVNGAMKVGILSAAYSFFMANVDGDVQAANYIKSVGSTKTNMPPVIDWEDGSVQGVPAAQQYVQAVKLKVALQRHSGKVPWIYWGHDTLLQCLSEAPMPAELVECPIIIARYGVPSSKIVLVPPFKTLIGWQDTDSAVIPGLAPGETVDRDWAFISMEQLQAYATVHLGYAA